MRVKLLLITFILLVFVTAQSCGPKKTKESGPVWKGTTETIDGVTVVKNPLDPVYGEEAFVLEEDLTIGEAEGREEYMFQNLRSIEVSAEGDIYALDYKASHIKVFDKDGRYLRTIGRSGQGPGEFTFLRTLSCTTRGEIVVGDLNRVSYFSFDGDYLKGIPLTQGSIMYIDVDSHGDIYGYSIEKEVYALKKYDQQLNELLLFGSSPLPSVEYNRTGKRNAFFTLLRWDIIHGDQVVTGYPEEGYVVKILDSSGNLIRRIEKEYAPLEITQKDFEEEIEGAPPEFIKDYYAPRHFPPFLTLRADDEGRVWVVTTEKASGGEKRIWDVFDAEGKYILKLALKSSPYIFNNKMYAIEEDENGFHCIKRYSITWRMGE